MGTVHQLLTEHGHQRALQLDLDRRVIDTAVAYMASEDLAARTCFPAGLRPHCRTSGWRMMPRGR